MRDRSAKWRGRSITARACSGFVKIGQKSWSLRMREEACMRPARQSNPWGWREHRERPAGTKSDRRLTTLPGDDVHRDRDDEDIEEERDHAVHQHHAAQAG